MAIPITIWQCSFCSKRFRTQDDANAHEPVHMRAQPDRTCVRCGESKPDYEFRKPGKFRMWGPPRLRCQQCYVEYKIETRKKYQQNAKDQREKEGTRHA
jgi:hypothetical protein